MSKKKTWIALFLILAMVLSFAGCGGNDKATSSAATDKKQADVVVIGAGMAGMSAAIEAAQQGAKVILLEKESVLGGSTKHAEGIFASGSPLQKQLDITVDEEALLREEFQFSNYKADGNLWRDIMSHSGEGIEWLMNMGVKFETVLSTGAGNKTWHIYEGFGKSVINNHMKPAAEKLGVEIIVKAPATELIMNNGQVAGVKASTSAGKELVINAKAVIIATGGFGNNEEMVKELTHLDKTQYTDRGASGHTGDGIKMAKSAGALTGERAIIMNLGNTIEGAGLTSELSVAAGQEPSLWVNQDGKRFVNEDVIWYYTRGSNAIMTQQKAFTVLDSAEIKRLETEGITVGWGMYNVPGKKVTKLSGELKKAIDNNNPSVFAANTLEELATKMGIDPATFVKTVNDYNTFSENGKDLEYYKDAKYLHPVKNGPYYGFRVKACNLTSVGGIRVNTNYEALTKDYQPIKGLYVAGMDADGFTGDTYGLTLPGSAQGIALYSGRVSGKNAAQFVKQQ